jgi:hypothetical protein
VEAATKIVNYQNRIPVFAAIMFNAVVCLGKIILAFEIYLASIFTFNVHVGGAGHVGKMQLTGPASLIM